jgi:hypothetical protein
MAEPISPSAAFVAAVSGVTLALLGVDYYALLWALVGAMLALGQASAMPRNRAILYVLLSTLLGAALGQGAVAFAGYDQRALLILASLLGGAGAQLLVAALLKAALRLIDAYRANAGGAAPPGAPGGAGTNTEGHP